MDEFDDPNFLRNRIIKLKKLNHEFAYPFFRAMEKAGHPSVSLSDYMDFVTGFDIVKFIDDFFPENKSNNKSQREQVETVFGKEFCDKLEEMF